MSFEDAAEKGGTSSSSITISALDQAVDQGEYLPEILSQYPGWDKMSRHRQFQYIHRGLDNREKQIMSQWAEINNILNFSKKPYLQESLRNLEKQLTLLKEDKERLFVEYSK